MAKSTENATERVRLFPSTHRRLKIRAATEGLTLAELIDKLDRS